MLRSKKAENNYARHLSSAAKSEQGLNFKIKRKDTLELKQSLHKNDDKLTRKNEKKNQSKFRHAKQEFCIQNKSDGASH